MISSLLVLLGDGIVSTISKWQRDKQQGRTDNGDTQESLIRSTGKGRAVTPLSSSPIIFTKSGHTGVHLTYNTSEIIRVPNVLSLNAADVQRARPYKEQLPSGRYMQPSRMIFPALIAENGANVSDSASHMLEPCELRRVQCKPLLSEVHNKPTNNIDNTLLDIVWGLGSHSPISLP